MDLNSLQLIPLHKPLITEESVTCSCAREECRLGGTHQNSVGKHPRFANWGAAGSSDPEQINEWQTRYDNPNWGAVTGVELEDDRWLIVLDIDPRNGGNESWEKLLSRLGKPWKNPQGTLTTLTGSGGFHHYLWVSTQRPTTKIKGFPGIDVQGGAGERRSLVVAPPSLHSSGKVYKWFDPKAEIQPLTPEWEAFLWPTREASVLALPLPKAQQVIEDGAGGNGEGRKLTLIRIGRALLARSVTAESIAVLIREENRSRCSPPLPASEVERVIEFVLRAPPGKTARVSKKEEKEFLAESKASEQTAALGAWADGLRLTKHGSILNCASNLDLILDNDPMFSELWFDELNQVRMRGDSWLSDVDAYDASVHLSKTYGIEKPQPVIHSALQAKCERIKKHPVKEYLESLMWDKQERINFLAANLLGAESEDARLFVVKFFLSAVRRIFEPGCPAPSLLCLVGRQGEGKSMFFRTLSRGYFKDTQVSLASKDAYQALQGAWIYEFGEIERITRQSDAHVKAFISSTEDCYRPAYGRETVRRKRNGVLVGTTNQVDFLVDETGNRRFHPVTVTKPIDISWLDSNADFLWAEAVHRYKAGEPNLLTRKEEASVAISTEGYRQEDSWANLIREELDKLSPQDRYQITMEWALTRVLDLKPGQIDRSHQTRVGRVLRELGYRPRQLSASGGLRRRVYELSYDSVSAALEEEKASDTQQTRVNVEGGLFETANALLARVESGVYQSRVEDVQELKRKLMEIQNQFTGRKIIEGLDK